MTSNNILIEKDLFIELIRYHIGEIRDEDIEMRIYKGLEKKLNKIVKHENYTKEKERRKKK